jgi:hypothetical protein
MKAWFWGIVILLALASFVLVASAPNGYGG